jgi:hypothetical protein
MKAGPGLPVQLEHAPGIAWAVQTVPPEPDLADLCPTRHQSQIAASHKYSAGRVEPIRKAGHTE